MCSQRTAFAVFFLWETTTLCETQDETVGGVMINKRVIFIKPMWIGLAGLIVMAMHSHAQEQIYRCGNEYTNTRPDRTKSCKLVEGGNVTVVEGVRLPRAPVVKLGSAATGTANSGPRMDAGQQKSRDSDARLILQTELQKAQARQQELTREYNNGEPEKRTEETRNHQKYIDRVAEIKANLMRNESDIAGIQRELNRLAPVSTNQ